MNPDTFPEDAAGRAGQALVSFADRYSHGSWQTILAFMTAANLADDIGLMPAQAGKPPLIILSYTDDHGAKSVMELSLSPEATALEMHQIIADVIQSIHPNRSFPAKPQFPE